MSLWSNETVLALVVAAPSSLLGYLGYRLAHKRDVVAEQTGIASTQIGAVGQVIDGLNKLVASLQADNTQLRADVAHLRQELAVVSETCERMKQEIADLTNRARTRTRQRR